MDVGNDGDEEETAEEKLKAREDKQGGGVRVVVEGEGEGGGIFGWWRVGGPVRRREDTGSPYRR